MDNQNNNDEMKDVYNCENSDNSGNRNPFIESEQSGLTEMDNNLSKETADCDNFSNQKEMTLAGEALHLEDSVQKTSVTENSVLNDKPNYEDKNESVELEGSAQRNYSHSGAAVNNKEQWNNTARLNRRHVKRYLDEPSNQMVIFSCRAYNSIISETDAKNPVETGGILLGHVLDNGFWIVTEVIPPGKSSVNEYAYFEYDTEFVNYVANRVAHQFKYPPQVLGLWHRHPGSMDVFSSVDDSTNATFSNINRTCGAISALVNLDPNFRITIYHAKINEYSQVQYQKMAYEVGDEFIPDEFFQLKYVSGTSKSHAVQNANDADAPKEALHNCSAVQDKSADIPQHWNKIEYTLKCVNITFELILILFLLVNIAIFIHNPLIDSLTDQLSAVQPAQLQSDQQMVGLTALPLTDQLSVVQPICFQSEPPSDALTEYSLASLQRPVQLTHPQFDCQPIVLQTYPLTVQSPSVKDWASLIKEFINFLRILNENSQVAAHNAEELINEKSISDPEAEPHNLESGLLIKTAVVPRDNLE